MKNQKKKRPSTKQEHKSLSFNGAQKMYSIKVTFKDETKRLQLSAQNLPL